MTTASGGYSLRAMGALHAKMQPASGVSSLRAMGALHATMQLAGAAAALLPIPSLGVNFHPQRPDDELADRDHPHRGREDNGGVHRRQFLHHRSHGPGARPQASQGSESAAWQRGGRGLSFWFSVNLLSGRLGIFLMFPEVLIV
jgi:hypothetical protein